MMEFFITRSVGDSLKKIDVLEKKAWINLIDPTEEELNYLQETLNILPNFLRDPLDEEERPRIDIEDDQKLIIVDIPIVYDTEEALRFETIPLGILVLDEHILTICLKESPIIEDFKNRKVRDLYTFMKTRFTLQILQSVASAYLKDLKHIDKKTEAIEKSLHKSTGNEEVFKQLELEKGLVFFRTSLKSNEIVMEKLLRWKHLRMYEEDQDLLEDVIIENKQAIEMANIYSSILNSMMNAFASIISNNLNIVMKFLTAVTIVLSIPTMIYSMYGMNVTLPLQYNSMGFTYVIIISIVTALITARWLVKKGMF
ncbi:MAG: magnesium transporter CorA family protein [Clostridiales bacterium]|nr:magnesium transporter CorA family protein [Clostridiales bacterium]